VFVFVFIFVFVFMSVLVFVCLCLCIGLCILFVLVFSVFLFVFVLIFVSVFVFVGFRMFSSVYCLSKNYAYAVEIMLLSYTYLVFVNVYICGFEIYKNDFIFF